LKDLLSKAIDDRREEMGYVVESEEDESEFNDD